MAWDVKTADMKYHAAMAKTEGVPLHKKEKKQKRILWDNVFAVFLVSLIK